MIYDDAFTVAKSELGTWKSYDADGNPLVTSPTEQVCINATRFYLKGLQDGGFTLAVKTYNSFVRGKL